MIDFHTHILPGVDDGAKSIEETIELLKEAQSVGVDKVILTSHYIESYYESNVKERTNIINSAKKLLNDEKINIDLIIGNEIYISENINELIINKKACSINNTRYVLFELPFDIKPINLYDVIYEMLQNKYIPVLAHPERYTFVQKNPNLVYDLIQTGVLMQSNYGSCIGQYGKKAQITVKKLLENDMVHFLGTDVHKMGTIYPKIPQILAKIENIIGKDKLVLITNVNPELVLENKKIEIPEPHKAKISLLDKILK